MAPDWRALMRIPLVAGRDLRPGERFPSVALVNQAFVQRYFPHQQPLGQWFEKTQGNNQFARMQIVGVVGDARYRNLREPITPTAYVPFAGGQSGIRTAFSQATLMLRATAAVNSGLRAAVAPAQPGFRVGNLETQQQLDDAQTVRDRLLASLATFFAAVALLLAAIGLFGVLSYAVERRRREIAVRMALGAQAGDLVAHIAGEALATVLTGTLVGLALGSAAAPSLAALLFQTGPLDPRTLAPPALALLLTACAAALIPVVRALRLPAAALLRGE